MKVLVTVLLALCLLMPVAVQAQENAESETFTAIKMDEEVVDHIVTEGNDIYVAIHKDYWDADFVVKISNKNMADYRSWLDGELEFPIKVYRSQQKQRQGYTYRINTAARFVEYWMGDRLVLHLERVQ